MYHELSDRIFQEAFVKVKELIQSSYGSCKSKSSWIEKNHYQFKRCTRELSKPLPWMFGLDNHIERFCAQNMNSTISPQAQLGLLLENVTLHSQGSNALGLALSFLEKTPTAYPVECSQLVGCKDCERKVIIQLMLMEMGILGLGDATPGKLLANHYSTLGPYFGSMAGHVWPHTPLSRGPTKLEVEFHEQMTKMTEILSNGTLKNISIIELPGFASKIPWLELRHKRQPNWPIELNFAIRNNIADDAASAFAKYKTLVTHWKAYMEGLFRKNQAAVFTPEMRNNRLFNFTNYIRDDIKTFLIATHGSFLTSEKNSSEIWQDVANDLFNGTKSYSHSLNEKNQYNKLFMECAFKQSLSSKKDLDHDGGCDLFHPTLTTNGLCYTFNSEAPGDIWKPSEITNTFQDLFPFKDSTEVFQGAAMGEGK